MLWGSGLAGVNCITSFHTEYISNFFEGIDPVIWEQAKQDNPDPKTIIPVPMVGFSELRSRLQHQEFMAKQHQTRLDVSINMLRYKQTNI